MALVSYSIWIATEGVTSENEKSLRTTDKKKIIFQDFGSKSKNKNSENENDTATVAPKKTPHWCDNISTSIEGDMKTG